MFCRVCGRSMADSDVFCTWCGTKVLDRGENNIKENEPPVSQNVAEADESAPINNSDTDNIVENPVPINGEPAETQHTESISSISSAAPANNDTSFSGSRQDTIQGLTGAQKEKPPVYPPPIRFGEEIPINREAAESKKPEKYYTFGHIVMCLSAVGVMAIVAGVFAGLYFSVVL